MSLFVHLGIGCVTKKYTNNISLFLCIIAAFLPDIILIPFSILNIDGINWTHSLVMVIVFSIVFGIITYLINKDIKISIIICLLVLSHWIVDFISWPLVALIPNAGNIPIFFEKNSTLGLGLYRSKIIAYPIEIISLIISIWVIAKIRKNDKKKVS